MARIPYLLGLEWKKLKNYRVFRVVALLYLVLLPGFYLTGKAIDLSHEDFAIIQHGKVFYSFPSIWEWLGYEGSWLCYFFLGFLGVLLVTNEFSFKTLRQGIINGLSRSEFFQAKVLIAAVLALSAALYMALCALAIGFWHTDTIYLSTVLKNSELTWRYALMAFGYLCFGMLLGTLLRRTGIALFLYLAYGAFIEPMLRYAVHFRYFRHKSMHYYPFNAFDDLVPIPISEMAEAWSRENGLTFFLSPSEAVLLSSLFILLFLGLMNWRFQRMDL